MAANRERRRNAGNKMSTLLDEEEEDDFYRISYGGFTETHNDRDYIQRNDDEDDIVDSDFSIDESDEPISDHEEENNKRKRPTNKRAYKEPPAKKAKITPKKKEYKTKPKAKRFTSRRLKRTRLSYTVLDGKISLRKSTAIKSAATERRVKVRKEAAKKKPKLLKTDDLIPTQEELLEEALLTEEENLASLEKFKQLEIDKKKSRPSKRPYNGPIIRYHSVSMPLIEVLPKRTRESNRVAPLIHDDWCSTRIEDEEYYFSRNRKSIAVSSGPRCERTFITFDNDIQETAFNSVFQPNKKRRDGDYLCSITKLPARYYDPVTRVYFRNKDAFKILREAYYQYLEASGELNSKDFEEWMIYREQVREEKIELTKLNLPQVI